MADDEKSSFVDDVKKGLDKEIKGKSPKIEENIKSQTNIYGSSNVSASNSGKTQEDVDNAAEEAEEKVEKTREEKAKLTQEKKDKIEALKQEYEDKKAKAKAGPGPILNFFASNLSLATIGTVDAGFSFLPFVGQVFGMVATLIWWAIPSIMLGSIRPITAAFKIQIMDMILGLILDSIEVLTAGMALPITMAIDFGFEFVAKRFTTGPCQAIHDTYKDNMENILAELDEEFEKKKHAIENDYKYRKKGFLSKHFIGRSGSRKTFSLLLFLAIGLLGPFVSGVIQFGNGASYAPLISMFIFLIVLSILQVIDKGQLVALIVFLGLNLFFTPLLSAITEYIPMGNNALIAPILFILFSILFMVKLQYDMSNKKFISAILIIFLLSSVPFTFNKLGSDSFRSQMEEAQLATSIELENMNIVEKAFVWFEYQTKLGKGEIIAGGEQEQTQQFIGVKITGAAPVLKEFRAGDTVRTQIYYTTGSYFPLKIWTACKIGTIQGVVKNNNVEIGAGSADTFVDCDINNVPKGSHKIDFHTVYPFTSTVEIPIKIMSKTYADYLTISAYQENKIELEDYVGGTKKARTSAGPVVIGVSNTMKDGVQILKMPTIIRKDDLEPIKLSFQVQPYMAMDSKNGREKVSRINEITIDSPLGIGFVCSFFDDVKEIPMTSEKGRNYAEIKGVDIQESTYTTLSCDLNIKDLDTLVPDQYFSSNTILISVKYDYSMYVSSMVKVI